MKEESLFKKIFSGRLPFIIIFFVLGILSGWLFKPDFLNKVNPTKEAAGIRQGGYSFINPLLECETGSQLEDKNLKQINHKIQDFVNKAISQNQTNHISVYYRDLNNGPWFGVNEQENFSPASLLKVPLMMAYLKQAESENGLLDKKIKFNLEDIKLQDFVESERTLEPGKFYTVSELIEKMIIFSDNDAFGLLTTNINADQINQVHIDLGLTVPEENTPQDFVSVVSYASLFRVLFNASYLDRNDSEYALGLLNQTEYKDGLVAGVPENIIVSHKFGIRNVDAPEKQLHDCGIIYNPEHPYLLCVMTRGNNLDELTGIIRDISQLVYQEIDVQYKKE